jgi:hypothetical protein
VGGEVIEKVWDGCQACAGTTWALAIFPRIVSLALSLQKCATPSSSNPIVDKWIDIVLIISFEYATGVMVMVVVMKRTAKTP